MASRGHPQRKDRRWNGKRNEREIERKRTGSRDEKERNDERERSQSDCAHDSDFKRRRDFRLVLCWFWCRHNFLFVWGVFEISIVANFCFRIANRFASARGRTRQKIYESGARLRRRGHTMTMMMVMHQTSHLYLRRPSRFFSTFLIWFCLRSRVLFPMWSESQSSKPGPE